MLGDWFFEEVPEHRCTGPVSRGAGLFICWAVETRGMCGVGQPRGQRNLPLTCAPHSRLAAAAPPAVLGTEHVA